MGAGSSTSHNRIDAPKKTTLAIPTYWRNSAIILVFAGVAVLGLFWHTSVSMSATWYRSATFNHCFLILPVSLYLIRRRRRLLTAMTPVPNFRGFPLLAVLGFGWALGHLANVLIVQQIAVVAMLPGLVWTVLGTSATRALLFPLAFLFFAVPLGEEIVPVLQDVTALFTVKGLQLSGIPVLLEERIIYVPSGIYEVVEACSGIRYVIPAFILGCLFSNLVYNSAIRRLAFITASVLLPILVNGIRAYSIVLMTHIGENSVTAGVVAAAIHRIWGHHFYGFLFFALVTALLFWLGLRWPETVDPDQQTSLSNSRPLAEMKNENGRTVSEIKMVFTTAVGPALLALAPLTAHMAINRLVTPAAIQAEVPSVLPPWSPMAQ